jgi:acyl-CoA synthetase (AMP-forming)/AMP-acid ligase II
MLFYGCEFGDLAELASATTQVQTFVKVGEGQGPGARYEELLASGSTELAQMADVADEGVVSLNYSSGTTGLPKGVVRTHENRLASTKDILLTVLDNWPKGGQFLHVGSLIHASGLFILPMLVLGEESVMVARFDPEEIVSRIMCAGRRFGTVLVPTMADLLLDAAGRREGGHALRSLGRVVYAGSPMPERTLGRLLEQVGPEALRGMYGLVEAIPPLSVLSGEDHRTATLGDGGRLKSVGRPVLGVEMRVQENRGDDRGGEVEVRGDHVMRGYWGGDHDAAKVRTAGGWLSTGDVGHFDDAGFLYLLGRQHDMIISGGYNVYPREVEDVLCQYEAIVSCCVFGQDDKVWGQVVAVTVQAAEGGSVSADEILKWCRGRLDDFKMPRVIWQLDQLPLGSTGKVSRSLCLSAALSGEARCLGRRDPQAVRALGPK